MSELPQHLPPGLTYVLSVFQQLPLILFCFQKEAETLKKQRDCSFLHLAPSAPHTHTQCPPSCSVSASLLSSSSSCSPVLSFLYNFPSHLPPYLFVHSFIHFILFSVSRLHLQSVSLLPVEPVYLGSPFLSSHHLLSYLFFSLKPNFFLILLPKCSLCRISSI